VLVCVVRVNGVSHVGGEEETPVDRLEVLLRVEGSKGTEDALGDLNGHVTVSTLSGGGADFFVVEKHNHVDLGVVTLFRGELRVLDQSIEGAQGTAQVVESR